MNASNHREMGGGALGSLLKLIVVLGLIGTGLVYWHYRSFAMTPLRPAQAHLEIRPGDSFRNVLATLRGMGIRDGDDLEWCSLPCGR